LAGKSKLLWIADVPAPANVREATRRQWELTPWSSAEPLRGQLDTFPLAVAYPHEPADVSRRLAVLADALDETAAVAIFMLPSHARAIPGLLPRRRGQLLCVDDDAPAAELAAKLDVAAELQPAISGLRSELDAYHRIGQSIKDLAGLDEEMRLAARVQRDFLPRRLPEVGHARFGVLYRPASWVSGDIYDVARLDETNVGFYIADAVGHGMPAALFTMFIKKALQTKRIAGNTYHILPPHMSLDALNLDICEQNLSSCQFCTAVYCVLDTADNSLTYCRAGHPEPILFRADDGVEILKGPGSLLGVFPEEQYDSRRIQLRLGDKLLAYSDGLQGAVNCSSAQELAAAMAPLIRRPRDEMLVELSSRIDAAPAGPCGEDDITVVVMEIEE